MRALGCSSFEGCGCILWAAPQYGKLASIPLRFEGAVQSEFAENHAKFQVFRGIPLQKGFLGEKWIFG